VSSEPAVTGVGQAGVCEVLRGVRSEVGLEDAAIMTSWVERRARRLRVPWDEDTPDARGFWKFVGDHYLRCDKLAWNFTRKMGYDGQEHMMMVVEVFEKLASPLVYLWDQWASKSPEEKAKWNPEILAKAKEHREAVEKAWEHAAQRGGQREE